jgi:hypothetical protein
MMTHRLRKSRRHSGRRLHDCPSTVVTMTVRPRDVQLAQPFASATPSSESVASASGVALDWLWAYLTLWRVADHRAFQRLMAGVQRNHRALCLKATQVTEANDTGAEV